MPTRRSAIALFAFFLLNVTSAAELPKLEFTHQDWELVCDNTRTCRAAGYSDERQSRRVSVLLTRQAGPGQPVAASIQFGHADEDAEQPPSPIPMTINGRVIGTVSVDHKTATGKLTAVQTSALLTAILKTTPIEWGVDFEPWTLSTKGANTVLLKMDEFQGRLDAPGALVRKGHKSESDVLLTKSQQAALIEDNEYGNVPVDCSRRCMGAADLGNEDQPEAIMPDCFT